MLCQKLFSKILRNFLIKSFSFMAKCAAALFAILCKQNIFGLASKTSRCRQNKPVSVHTQKLLNKYSNGIHQRFNFFRAPPTRALTTSNFLITKILNCTHHAHTERERETVGTRSAGPASARIIIIISIISRRDTRISNDFPLWMCVWALCKCIPICFQLSLPAQNGTERKNPISIINNSVGRVLSYICLHVLN